MFVLEIWEDYERVTFYTVRLGDSDTTETDKFIDRFEKSEHKSDLLEILQLIDLMGIEKGADSRIFSRNENQAQALPPYFYEINQFHLNSLRLFCMRISDDVVVLFNGGLKTAQTAQDSELAPHFRAANDFAQKIHKSLFDPSEKFLEIRSKRIVYQDEQDSEEIILD